MMIKHKHILGRIASLGRIINTHNERITALENTIIIHNEISTDWINDYRKLINFCVDQLHELGYWEHPELWSRVYSARQPLYLPTLATQYNFTRLVIVSPS